MSARILVIDQSRIVHQTVRLGLGDLAEITAVTDASALGDPSDVYDLAVVSADFDVQLPAMVSELRRQSPGLRLVVAVSVMKELSADVHGRLGPCEVVRKPWVSREFRQLVERLLSEEVAPTPDSVEPQAIEMGDETSLPTALNEASLEAITAPPLVDELDSPFSAPLAESSFDDMPSTREFAELVSGVPEAVGDMPPAEEELPPIMDDELPPIGDLEAEVESMVSDFDAGLSALEEQLNDLPEVGEEPGVETLPPEVARQGPDLANQVLEMTTPPDGELGALDLPPLEPEVLGDDLAGEEVLSALPIHDAAHDFGPAGTDEVSALDEVDDEAYGDAEASAWGDSGTGEFSEASDVDELHDGEHTNASMIAALNALEEAAGVAEEAAGMPAVDAAATPEVAEVRFEQESEAPSAATTLSPEQWIALRAEMRDTVEAMIRELVPELAERIIRDEIERLKSGWDG